jgi:hypothetical protein
MSGLVPLGLDIMRYLDAISDHDLYQSMLSNILEEISFNKVERYRSEIGTQAKSFGATLTTKLVLPLSNVRKFE